MILILFTFYRTCAGATVDYFFFISLLFFSLRLRQVAGLFHVWAIISQELSPVTVGRQTNISANLSL